MKHKGKHFQININGTNVSYLYIRKNACSAWKRVFINESKHTYKESEYKTSMRFMGAHHSISEKRARKSKHRIVVLREPLGRIVSAYINQFVNRIDEATDFHLQVSQHLGKPVESVTFREFVNGYLLDLPAAEVNNHFWSQKSHLGDIPYNKIILLQNLYRDTRKLFGKAFADKYFKQKVNATSNAKKYEIEAYDLTAKEINDNYQKGMGWPSTNSFLKDLNIYRDLSNYYKDDTQLYESRLKAKVAMVVWNDFQNDARVLKEASSLVKNGYAVTVNALHDPKHTTKAELLKTGVKVKRVNKSAISSYIQAVRNKKINTENKPVDGDEPKVITENKISKWSHLARLILSLPTHLRLFTALYRSRPDIIHAHDFNTLIVSWLASKFCGAKLIYDAHEISTSREGYQSIRKYIAIIEKYFAPKAESVIATTDLRAKYLSRSYGIPRPLVLQNRPPQYELMKSDTIRRELDLNPSWPIVIYQGGLQAGRGLGKLVSAFAEVDNAYLVFVGGGRLESTLKQLVKQKGMIDNVKFIPKVPLSRLPYYTASADIGVQPIENTCMNHYTTDSNKLFEYVLAGLPVIATDFPEINKIVNKYQVGLLIDESVAELSSAINKLVQDSQLREEYRVNALNARKELSWESQEQNLLDLYNNIKLVSKA